MNTSPVHQPDAETLTPPPADFAALAETALLARLRDGDEDAFRELVEDNGGRMLATARRLVRSEEDAADVVQETFLLAFRSLSAFEGRARLSTWLHRIVVNVALMRLRRRRRHPEVMIEDLLPSFSSDGRRRIEDHDHVDPTPADALERAQMRILVRRCIDRLPQTHRVILVLRDIEDLTTEETADVLGLRTGAVKVRLHRARQALKTLLQKELVRGGEAATDA